MGKKIKQQRTGLEIKNYDNDKSLLDFLEQERTASEMLDEISNFRRSFINSKKRSFIDLINSSENSEHINWIDMFHWNDNSWSSLNQRSNWYSRTNKTVMGIFTPKIVFNIGYNICVNKDLQGYINSYGSSFVYEIIDAYKNKKGWNLIGEDKVSEFAEMITNENLIEKYDKRGSLKSKVYEYYKNTFLSNTVDKYTEIENSERDNFSKIRYDGIYIHKDDLVDLKDVNVKRKMIEKINNHFRKDINQILSYIPKENFYGNQYYFVDGFDVPQEINGRCELEINEHKKVAIIESKDVKCYQKFKFPSDYPTTTDTTTLRMFYNIENNEYLKHEWDFHSYTPEKTYNR